jgi:hypothetical protein
MFTAIHFSKKSNALSDCSAEVRVCTDNTMPHSSSAREAPPFSCSQHQYSISVTTNCSVLLENLIAAQLLKTLPIFY